MCSYQLHMCVQIHIYTNTYIYTHIFGFGYCIFLFYLGEEVAGDEAQSLSNFLMIGSALLLSYIPNPKDLKLNFTCVFCSAGY